MAPQDSRGTLSPPGATAQKRPISIPTPSGFFRRRGAWATFVINTRNSIIPATQDSTASRVDRGYLVRIIRGALRWALASKPWDEARRKLCTTKYCE